MQSLKHEIYLQVQKSSRKVTWLAFVFLFGWIFLYRHCKSSSFQLAAFDCIIFGHYKQSSTTKFFLGYAHLRAASWVRKIFLLFKVSLTFCLHDKYVRIDSRAAHPQPAADSNINCLAVFDCALDCASTAASYCCSV